MDDEKLELDTGQEAPATEVKPEPVERDEPQELTDEASELDDLESEESDNPEAEGDEEESEGEGGEEELAEVEVDGEVYKVPAAIKDKVMMQADYTRKTQEVADERRQIAEQRQSIEQTRQATDAELNARAQLIGINQRLDQYKTVDWNAWDEQDYAASQAGFRDFQMLQQTKTETEQNLGQMVNQRTVQAQQETAKRIQETQEYARSKVKGWSPELDRKVIEFAQNDLGFSQQDIADAINPAIYETLHLAWIGKQSLQKQTAKPKSNAPPAKPLSKVSGKSGPTARKTLGEMSMSEYAEYRNRQERERKKRGSR